MGVHNRPGNSRNKVLKAGVSREKENGRGALGLERTVRTVTCPEKREGRRVWDQTMRTIDPTVRRGCLVG